MTVSLLTECQLPFPLRLRFGTAELHCVSAFSTIAATFLVSGGIVLDQCPA